MISNFAQTKQLLETIFHVNWTDTPIHYSGMEFDTKGKDKWINITYQPLVNRSSSLSNAGVKSRGVLHIVCWGKTELESAQLADTAVAVLTINLPVEVQVKSYEVSDQGFHNNKAFYVVSFNVESVLCEDTLTPYASDIASLLDTLNGEVI